METDHETKDQILAIIQEFKKRRRRQLMVLVPVILAIGAGVIAEDTDLLDRIGIPMNTFGPVFFAVILGMIGFSFYNWRCPQCRKYLGRDINPRFCTKCGAQLRL